MATQLDFAEQEQLDQLRYFWKSYGNLITWLLVIVLAGFAAYNGWNWWQRNQAVEAASIFDELDRAAKAGQVDRIPQIFGDLRDRYPGTTFAHQGGLIAATALADKGKADEARTTLAWVADKASDEAYGAIAKLRLAGMLMDAKQFDEALKQVDDVPAGGAFAALASDRRGDVLLAQDRKADALAAYKKAWDGMAADTEYRRLVEAKLTALGAAPSPVAVDTAAAASAVSASTPASSQASATGLASSPAASSASAPASVPASGARP